MRAHLFTYSTGLRFLLMMIIAALFVLGLMATPAFAQAESTAGDSQAKAGSANITFVDCSQVQVVVANQYNSGDAISVSQGQYGNAISAIAQKLNISPSQVNACLGGAGGGNPPESTTPETTSSGTTTGQSTTSEGTTSQLGDTTTAKGVIPGTISDSGLPNTGGAPLPGAIIGFAMVAAGILSAGAIVRRGR